jgi:hypothetical protein
MMTMGLILLAVSVVLIAFESGPIALGGVHRAVRVAARGVALCGLIALTIAAARDSDDSDLAGTVSKEPNRPAVTRVPAATLPAGEDGLIDQLLLRGPGETDLTLAHYGYGAYLGTNQPRIEAFVGNTAGTGELGVRSRSPADSGDGALLYARDWQDKHNLALDYRAATPRLLSESPNPLRVETPIGADLELRPGAFDRKTGKPVRRSGAKVLADGELVVRGTQSLTIRPDAGTVQLPELSSAPSGQPRGSLALVRGELLVMLDEWTPVGGGR